MDVEIQVEINFLSLVNKQTKRLAQQKVERHVTKVNII